jgi:hypothetical protein
MRLTEIVSKPVQGEWVHEHSETCNCHDVKGMLSAYRPGVRMNIRDAGVLTEATYKELAGMIDPNFLRQGMRASELKAVEFHGFEEDTMHFLVPSKDFDDNSIKYMCSIKFEDWDQIGSDPDMDFKEKALMLLWVGNIKLNCTDPSFLYWGYQYLLTALDSAINPETRKPVIRNPQERGIVCKHLNRVLKALPFHNGKIAAEMKRQFGGG